MRKRNFKRLWTRSFASMCQIAFVLGCFGANAAPYIPSSQIAQGSDHVQTTDGFRCSQAVAPDMYLEAGGFTESNDFDYGNNGNDNVGGYVKVVVPIFADRQRLNCNKLYEYELKIRAEDRALDRIAESVFREQ